MFENIFKNKDWFSLSEGFNFDTKLSIWEL